MFYKELQKECGVWYTRDEQLATKYNLTRFDYYRKLNGNLLTNYYVYCLDRKECNRLLKYWSNESWQFSLIEKEPSMSNEVKVGDKFTGIASGTQYTVVFVNNYWAVVIARESDCPMTIGKQLLLGIMYRRGWPIKLVHGGIYKMSNGYVCQAVKMPTWDHYKMVFKSGDIYGRYNEYGSAQCVTYDVVEELEKWPD